MDLKSFYTLLLIIQTIYLAECIFKSKVAQLKAKAKSVYNSNFNKKKEWQFLGYDPSEYAGTNQKYREENTKKWEEYYACLNKQKENLGEHGAMTPEAILRFEGGTVKLNCKICLNPREQENIEAVEWYFGELSDKYLEQIFYNEHIMLSPEDKTLIIYNLQETHSGQYVCVLGDSLTVPYYITVINGTRNVSEVHTEDSVMGPHPKQALTLPEYNIVLDTDWSEWSPCSRCKKMGRRHKIGYCLVLYQNQQDEIAPKKIKHDTNIILANIKHLFMNDSHHIELAAKPNISIETKHQNGIDPIYIELLKIFKYGIPCRSHILPAPIKNLKQVQERMDEVMVGFCKIKCGKAKLFEVRDQHGNLVEKANNSAGIYSMVQGLPPVEPEVERRLQYEKKGDSIIIICPGNLNSDSPVLWQINSKNVVPELLFQESSGRMHVSLLDRIHIKKSKVADTNIYSCWQNNELAGTVRLVVEKRIRLNFNHHMMLAAAVIVLSTFIIVFVKAFLGRKHAKIK